MEVGEEFGEIGIIDLPGHCLHESVSEASPSQTLLNLKSTASRLSVLLILTDHKLGAVKLHLASGWLPMRHLTQAADAPVWRQVL